MDAARNLILLVAAVALLAGVATRFGRTAPLVLVVGGFAASYLPWIDEVRVDSDVILVGVLPPLLYATAIRTSLVAFRANVRPIALLSVGLVVFSTVGVGLIAWAVLPIPLAAAFALGAVVAPPDAVAATAVGRKVGLPRRVVTILEGESLVNDATAIVCLRVAIAAMAGDVSGLEITEKFLVSAVGGLLVGVAAAFLISQIRRRVDEEVIDITISLITPFVAYLAAEEIHASGVLAVVVCGLLLGHKSHAIQSAPSRVLERGNWTTIQFILEHTVFFLIGLQGRTIIDDLSASSLSAARITLAAAAVLVGVIVLRFVYVYPSTYVPRWIPSVRRRDPAPSWQVPTIIAWAGMRGVVTIAAVFLLPDDTPHREVLVLIALLVAAGTLLIQGATLPMMARRLRIVGPDRGQDNLIEARLYQRAGRAGIDALEASLTGDEPAEVVQRLRERAFQPADAAWERLGGDDETPSQVYARLRAVMLEAERADLLTARDAAEAPDDVLRRVLDALDVEESVISMVQPTASQRDTELVAPSLAVDLCEHLTEAADLVDARTPDGCEECLAEGSRWVHLRKCLSCGHVGCCDSSVGRHGESHFRQTGHPVMRSFEPGEAWRWCYVDETVG